MIITGAKICAENAIYENGTVEIIADKITRVLSEPIDDSTVTTVLNENRFSGYSTNRLPNNWLVFPGMIDLHIHGAYGYDAMDASKKSYAAMSKMLPNEGVTAYLATTMTQAKDEITAALNCIESYRQHQKRGEGATLLGVNLEGPFIAPDKSCAQPKENVLQPDLALLKLWHEIINDGLKIITFAPEIKGNDELIKYAVEHGIVASVGHSNATYAEVCAAIAWGCTHATHLFNAMPPLHHRQPGAVLALLLDNNVYVELIADGVHLHPAILQLVLRLKGADKITLITDAISAKGLTEGDYKLAGQPVHVADGCVFMSGGILAGSVLTMGTALRNMLKFTNCSLLDVSKMVAKNPARQLGIEKTKGSIAVGKDADIVIFDENYNIMLTLCCGKINYMAQKMQQNNK